ncbi:hypothetical protein [uncultured Selenomonas sp.]|uniref:hypothetical protein n=1 Tax=uncultured Selenomonas sp. TaxID=159275 RepID=UPI0028D1058A|nr:hypothetical protein [uncultured Selenomonas sp.]
MPRKIPATATEVMLSGLSEGIRAMVAEAISEGMERLKEDVLKELPDALVMPTFPAGEEMHRLLSPEDVAVLLSCSEDTVRRRMDDGDLCYIVERGSDRRRIPYAWVVEYIYKHTRYTGPMGKRREVVNNA